MILFGGFFVGGMLGDIQPRKTMEMKKESLPFWSFEGGLPTKNHIMTCASVMYTKWFLFKNKNPGTSKLTILRSHRPPTIQVQAPPLGGV